jgi:hypothetical protein
MKIRSLISFIALLFTLIGCAKPVQSDKAAYVGEWASPTIYLSITQEGNVRYKRTEGNKSTKIEAPLIGFTGNNFEVGVGPMKTMFVVSKPPYQEGAEWRMVVDGVMLTKKMENWTE